MPRSQTSAAHRGKAKDLFVCVWDEDSLERQRRLLKLVFEVGESCEIRLFLFWGTLLGHVREGRILEWDDDVDLAFFDPGRDQYKTLKMALQAAGLCTFDHDGKILKVYDPANVAWTKHPWTWPYVDIFSYSTVASAEENLEVMWPVPRTLILPGRITTFEGLRCWEPEQPLALLDRQYREWRTTEISPNHSHRLEIGTGIPTTRRISTNGSGRKVRDEPSS